MLPSAACSQQLISLHGPTLSCWASNEALSVTQPALVRHRHSSGPSSLVFEGLEDTPFLNMEIGRRARPLRITIA